MKRYLSNHITQGLISFAFAFTTLSLSAQSPKGHFIGVGLYTQNLFTVTTSNDASAALLGDISESPLFIWKSYFQPFSQTTIAPSLGYTLLPRKSKDGAAEISLLTLSLPVIHNINNSWDWSYGVSLLRQSIEGAGGTVVLNNGTGTSTFYLPTGTATTQVYSVDVGTSWHITTSSELSFDLRTTGILSNRRSFFLFIAYHYNLFSGGF
ncbi:MAG: hypothetical protein KDD61_15830 [Bdellovibrionales bacterium]|nr:hypothetical protein [Bdellovibrionales bacterium]